MPQVCLPAVSDEDIRTEFETRTAERTKGWFSHSMSDGYTQIWVPFHSGRSGEIARAIIGNRTFFSAIRRMPHLCSVPVARFVIKPTLIKREFTLETTKNGVRIPDLPALLRSAKDDLSSFPHPAARGVWRKWANETLGNSRFDAFTHQTALDVLTLVDQMEQFMSWGEPEGEE